MWYVGISATNSSAQDIFCGGALVGSQWVLSTAACFGRNASARLSPNQIQVWFNLSNAVNPSGAVTRSVQHYYYLRDEAQSLILLRLSSAAPSGATPVRITQRTYTNGTVLGLPGYGTLELPASINVLRYAQVTYGATGCGASTLNHTFCGGFNTPTPQGPCSGDAGGSAYINEYRTPHLVGLLSYDNFCSNFSLVPQILYNLVDYRNWIYGIISNESDAGRATLDEQGTALNFTSMNFTAPTEARPSMNKTHYKVLILGAGAAGLAAAGTLKGSGETDFLIIEARERVGGRMRGYNFLGTPIEFGANWVNGYSPANPIYDLVQAAGLNCNPTIGANISVYDNTGLIPNFLAGEGLAVFGLPTAFPGVVQRANGSDVNQFAAINLLVSSFPGITGYNALPARFKAAINALVANGGLNPNDRGIIRDQDANLISTVNCLLRDPDGYEKLAQFIVRTSDLNSSIALNSLVSKVHYNNSSVLVELNDGQNLTADHAIVTFPLGVLQKKPELFSPPVPQDQQAAFERWGFGNLLKVFIRFDHKWWNSDDAYWWWNDGRPENFFPSYFINLASSHLLGPSHPVILTFAIPPIADRFISQSKNATIDELMLPLRDMHGIANYSRAIDLIFHNWAADELSFGSYSTNKFNATLSDKLMLNRSLGTPPRVHFAGEHTSFSMWGFVHGAFDEGLSRGNHVLDLLRASVPSNSTTSAPTTSPPSTSNTTSAPTTSPPTSNTTSAPTPSADDQLLVDPRVFNPQFYFNRYREELVALNFTSPDTVYLHWISRGISEGRVGSATFDPLYYLQSYSDLAAAYGTNLRAATLHYVMYGATEGRKGCSSCPQPSTVPPPMDDRFFDSNVYNHDYYISRYLDVQQANNTDARLHWFLYGINEGRRASPSFDPSFYLRNNPDLLALAGRTNFKAAVLHYLQNGRREGRVGCGSCEPVASSAIFLNENVFNSTYYLSRYPDLVANGVSTSSLAGVHWINSGIHEGRRASSMFDPVAYLNRYSDLLQAFGRNNFESALIHYVVTGRAEGRESN